MDYTSILERIAVAGEAMVNGTSYYFTVGAILASALIGFIASNRIYRKQQQSENKKKLETIEMISFLLNKELSERWDLKIKSDLDQVFERESDIAILHGYQSMELSSHDFFTIKRVSENFQSFYYLENSLMKEIVDAYVSLKDFNDICLGAQSLYSEIKEYKKTLKNNDYAGNVDDAINKKFHDRMAHYNKSAQEGVDRIDKAFKKINSDLKK
ncbi:hypothetical protein HJ179_21065 [Vibrio parahaemolyticus]|nr:hypothetical protein [Vibrio parahaemolyticus]MBE3825724.1 hypothetical protein [Vibrio parahaemolyticus]